MKNLIPRTATEAHRLACTAEAAAKLDAVMFWNGDNTCTLDSWKTNEDGKRVKSRYEVDLNAETCTCPDFTERGKYCKHLLKAESVANDTLFLAELDEMFA